MIDPQVYNEYYRRVPVLFEIVKIMQGREVAFLDGRTSIRCVKIHSVEFFNLNRKQFGIGSLYFPNFYISVAKYERLPVFSFDLNRRYAEQKIFRGSFENFVTGYDFFIDIDFKGDFPETYRNAKRIYLFLNEYVPFSVRFSGKGFHIIVEDEFFNFIPLESRIMFEKFVLEKMISMLSLNKEVIDVNVIQKRRIFKVPYSLDVKTGRVCYPLTKEEFLNFDYALVDPNRVLNIKNRGIPVIEPVKLRPDFFKGFYDEKEFKEYCNTDRTTDRFIVDEIMRGV